MRVHDDEKNADINNHKFFNKKSIYMLVEEEKKIQSRRGNCSHHAGVKAQ